jgi:UDP-galactose transporter B1
MALSARLKAAAHFIACTGGIFAAYVVYAMIQEWLYSHRDAHGHTWEHTLTLLQLQCVVHVIGAVAWAAVSQGSAAALARTPALPYTRPAFTYIGAMLCSAEALKYVSYPTQALAKSSKLVPVMLINILVFRQRHTLAQYALVVLVTVGTTIFQWKDSHRDDPGNSLYGTLLLLASLALDGFTGPAQQDIKQKCVQACVFVCL